MTNGSNYIQCQKSWPLTFFLKDDRVGIGTGEVKILIPMAIHGS